MRVGVLGIRGAALFCALDDFLVQLELDRLAGFHVVGVNRSGFIGDVAALDAGREAHPTARSVSTMIARQAS
jgi:hypothetical protein